MKSFSTSRVFFPWRGRSPRPLRKSRPELRFPDCGL